MKRKISASSPDEPGRRSIRLADGLAVVARRSCLHGSRWRVVGTVDGRRAGQNERTNGPGNPPSWVLALWPSLKRQRAEIEVDCGRAPSRFSVEDDAARSDCKPGERNPEEVRIVLVVGMQGKAPVQRWVIHRLAANPSARCDDPHLPITDRHQLYPVPSQAIDRSAGPASPGPGLERQIKREPCKRPAPPARRNATLRPKSSGPAVGNRCFDRHLEFACRTASPGCPGGSPWDVRDGERTAPPVTARRPSALSAPPRIRAEAVLSACDPRVLKV